MTVERAARAIAIVTIPGYADDAHWAEHWAWYLRYRGKGGCADYSSLAVAEKQARAAIEAIREPTEAMELAAEEADETGRAGPAEHWRAMIDDALK